MSNNYNQYRDYYTRNACSLVMLLNIMKYRYGIIVKPTFLMKIAIFFDKIGKWSPSGGAVFDIIARAFVWELNRRLGLNFKLITNKISTLSKNDHRTYGLGIKGYSTKKFNVIKKDGVITKEEMDYLTTWSGGIGHATNWDGSAGGYFIDTDGGKNTKMSLVTLKYGEFLGLFRDNIRTIQPDDKFTKEVCKLCLELFIAEKKNKLESCYKKHINSIYLAKARELYFYGR